MPVEKIAAAVGDTVELVTTQGTSVFGRVLNLEEDADGRTQAEILASGFESAQGCWLLVRGGGRLGSKPQLDALGLASAALVPVTSQLAQPGHAAVYNAASAAIESFPEARMHMEPQIRSNLAERVASMVVARLGMQLRKS